MDDSCFQQTSDTLPNLPLESFYPDFRLGICQTPPLFYQVNEDPGIIIFIL